MPAEEENRPRPAGAAGTAAGPAGSSGQVDPAGSTGPGMGGRVAVVTGGSRGIGRAVCEALARRGARVVVGYHADERGAEETAARCTALGGEPATPCRFDVADYAAVTAAVAGVVRAHRRVDVLVNNAGVGDAAAVLPTGPVEEWAAPVRTNLMGTLHCIKAASAYLLMSGRGAIVNVASIAGITGIAGLSGYAASKAGILGMTRALSREYARHRVRVNAVAPGYTADTGMVARIDDASLKEIVGRVALERLARPEEIAAAVAFLASDEAAYITGHTLVVDGGLTA
ncbi:SDR family oxidoreductase [Streptomonospora sp. S1-112]|uniref:SDR family oxidoreductase n=1 Tax=Streptomonospora mangrovi TaxID=2883123 RepID=A0A9X3NLF9_9ACTN|nr:SDR family oxidoreductase [Streptomonospora mangrovi]MDA0565652.1 SDR family oxidoreductase [Streptomonospora mangrovi]